MATARTVVKRALQIAGVLTKQEDPAADEAADGLSVLNGMLSTWSNDTLLLYARVLENFSLTANKESYTIGPGGDFDTPRPIFISSMFYRSGDIDYPVVRVSESEYDSFVDKDTSGIPREFRYDRSASLGTITLYPPPNEGGTLYFRSEKLLTQLGLDDDLAFPEGWEHALIYNLAVLLAPEYGQTASPLIRNEAAASKRLLKRATSRNRSLADAPPLTRAGAHNIYTGTFT